MVRREREPFPPSIDSKMASMIFNVGLRYQLPNHVSILTRYDTDGQICIRAVEIQHQGHEKVESKVTRERVIQAGNLEMVSYANELVSDGFDVSLVCDQEFADTLSESSNTWRVIEKGHYVFEGLQGGRTLDVYVPQKNQNPFPNDFSAQFIISP